MLEDQVKIHWAAALSIKGIGPKTLEKIQIYLNKTRSSWDDVWVNKRGIFNKIGLNTNIVESIKKFTIEHSPYSYYRSLKNEQVSVVIYKDAAYPHWLKKIEDKPPLLFVKGKLNINPQLPIAVIGTRNMTLYGKRVTHKITSELVNLGACLISGFMYGVDVAAQKQALSQGGTTIGVLGSGFNHIYPSSQTDLLNNMIDSGKVAFISEYPPRMKPAKGTFPRRNRIIAGMSLAVVVTEAALKSGTHITVGRALDYGRDVFAVPGPITSPFSEGVRYMLNQGAELVASGEEVIASLSARHWNLNLAEKPGNKNPKLEILLKGLNLLEKKIYQQLEQQALTVDEIAALTNASAAKVMAGLTQLEVRGLVVHQSGRWLNKK